MKIPEGWPTEEMLKEGLRAFWDAYGSDLSQIASPLESAFKAMLASAPTPPAPKNPWKDAIAFECEVVNVPFNEESPDDTLMRLMNHYELMEREVPPAQEDEPYAYAYENIDLPEDVRAFYGPTLQLDKKERIPPNWKEICLYTHPKS